MVDGVLFVANSGDTRAVLRREGERLPLRLSVDHKPDSERDRLNNSGAEVTTVPGSGTPPCSFFLFVVVVVGINSPPPPFPPSCLHATPVCLSCLSFCANSLSPPLLCFSIKILVVPRVNGGLAVSRGFLGGAADFNRAAVIWTPHVGVHVLEPRDSCIILASDGLWYCRLFFFFFGRLIKKGRKGGGHDVVVGR